MGKIVGIVFALLVLALGISFWVDHGKNDDAAVAPATQTESGEPAAAEPSTTDTTTTAPSTTNSN